MVAVDVCEILFMCNTQHNPEILSCLSDLTLAASSGVVSFLLSHLDFLISECIIDFVALRI